MRITAVDTPVTYNEVILSRAAGYCAGLSKKTLIVGTGVAVKTAEAYIQNLGLQAYIHVCDTSGLGMDRPLAVDPVYGAVFTASENARTMQALRRLCARYQDSGVPVLALTGWPLPMDAEQFKFASDISGNLTIPAMFDLSARYCGNGTTGDYFEFGTFLGYTLQCAYHGFEQRTPGIKRRFFAFDSFAGIVGAKPDEKFTDGSYAASVASFRFANLLAQVPVDAVATVEGAYQDTLVGDGAKQTRQIIGEAQAAVVHIDCDVEEPAKLALDFVTPYVKQGTLLLFDEYDLHSADNAKGERAALRAWLRENPQFDVELYRSYHVHAKAFILHKK